MKKIGKRTGQTTNESNDPIGQRAGLEKTRGSSVQNTAFWLGYKYLKLFRKTPFPFYTFFP